MNSIRTLISASLPLIISSASLLVQNAAAQAVSVRSDTTKHIAAQSDTARTIAVRPAAPKAAAPGPAVVLPTVTPINSLGDDQTPLETTKTGISNAAHKIELKVTIDKTSKADITAAIFVEGPTFDAPVAAQALLTELRRKAWKDETAREYLKDHRREYWGLLLMPNSTLLDHLFFHKWKRVSGPKNRAQEQRLASGFVAAHAQQLMLRYPDVAKSTGAGSPPSTAKRRLRPHYAINGPADFPRSLRPGTVVSFAFQDVNWLKYLPEVESKGFVRQFSLASELSKQDPTPNTESKEGINSDITPTPENLLDDYQAFNTLKEELTSTYRADYWPDPLADQKQREALELRIFGKTLIAATTFAEKPLELLGKAQAFVSSATQRVTAANAALAANKDPNKKKPLKDTLTQAIKEQKALEDQLHPLLKDKATIESADYKQEVTTLGDALVKLRAVNRPRPSTTVVLPDDKDEADINIDYKIRPDYKQPPGVGATIAKQSFTIFLLPRFRITGSVGPYYTGLVDHRFSFVGDSIPATDPTKYLPRKRIVRDNSDEKFSGVGASAFIHFEYRLSPSFSAGAALGAGIQNDGLRLLLGPSLVFGNSQRVALSGGFAGGRTIRLAEGYHEGQLLKESTPQVPTRVINNNSWFISLSYNLSSSRN